MPLFNWNPQPGEHVLNYRFWIYGSLAGCLTAVLFLLYFMWPILVIVDKEARKKVGKIMQNWGNKRTRISDEESCDIHKDKQS